MKDRIRSAQIVVPCADLNRSLGFFTDRLGFRVEMIFPADNPQTVVISGYGLVLRLEKADGDQISPLTLRLEGAFADLPAGTPAETFSPDGVRVIFVDDDAAAALPAVTQGFVLSTPEDDGPRSEGRAGMLYRDLIPNRLGGRFVASHISIPQGGAVPDYVHYHKIRFQMIYCLTGWARLVYEGQGAPFLMSAGDCVLQPPEIRHRVLETSAGFEVLEIGCPAIHETFAEHEMELPDGMAAPDKRFGGQRFVHHQAGDSVWRRAPEKNLEYADTGISAATGGLAGVEVLRAAADTTLPVRHRGEFLFFFVLTGEPRLTGGEKTFDLKSKSGFVLPAGRNFFIDIPKDAELLRVSLPAATGESV